jgi:hypothetical protein
MRGFGLLVSGKSNARTYVVQRKLPGGNTRRVTVGAANVLDLDEARQQARLLLAEFYSGVDPKAKRRAEARRGRTLRDACEDYLRGNTRLSERSRLRYRADVHRYLSAGLDRPLRDLRRDMVEKRHRQIAEETAKPGRSGGGDNTGQATANQAIWVARAVYNFALDQDETLPPNPVRLKKIWSRSHRALGS